MIKQSALNSLVKTRLMLVVHTERLSNTWLMISRMESCHCWRRQQTWRRTTVMIETASLSAMNATLPLTKKCSNSLVCSSVMLSEARTTFLSSLCLLCGSKCSASSPMKMTWTRLIPTLGRHLRLCARMPRKSRVRRSLKPLCARTLPSVLMRFHYVKMVPIEWSIRLILKSLSSLHATISSTRLRNSSSGSKKALSWCFQWLSWAWCSGTRPKTVSAEWRPSTLTSLRASPSITAVTKTRRSSRCSGQSLTESQTRTRHSTLSSPGVEADCPMTAVASGTSTPSKFATTGTRKLCQSRTLASSKQTSLSTKTKRCSRRDSWPRSVSAAISTTTDQSLTI